MFRLRCTTDCQPLTKNGNPHQRTTGVASANSIQAHTFAGNKCCMGMEGRKDETISASMGAASATLIHSRRVMSASSGFDSSAVISRGSSAMPQIGQEPGASRTICGCIGQVYSVRLAGAVTVAGSSAMPQIGQEPGASRTICGCIGQVYSVRLAGAVTVAGSSAMPHLGQLPGPGCLISGCMGHVYSPCGSALAGGFKGAASGLACKYFSGEARNLAAQPWLQK